MSATGIAFADGGPSDNVVIGTYEVEAFALASQGMQQQAPAAHARGGAMMRPYVPDPVHWDDGKRCLLVTSPTGVSPAAKKVTRWSSAEDALFADFIGQQHVVGPHADGWPRLTSTRCADFENVTVVVHEGG